MEYKILYEDKDILVCFKPSGLATQTAKIGEKDLESLLKNYLNKDAFLGVVHRLDQPVSGILVFGKTKESTKRLNHILAEKESKKFYYALCFGTPKNKEESIVLVNYLKKDIKTKLAKNTTSEDKEGKYAKLTFHVKEKRDRATLIEVELHTGRFHQIRAQMSSYGMPIMGDRKYASKECVEQSKTQGIKTICLCAYKLSFQHPMTKKQMIFSIENEKELLPQWVE
ncbi:MAG: RluA family pseudouridine synthase [Lachnospiraceae bacterium]